MALLPYKEYKEIIRNVYQDQRCVFFIFMAIVRSLCSVSSFFGGSRSRVVGRCLSMESYAVDGLLDIASFHPDRVIWYVQV